MGGQGLCGDPPPSVAVTWQLERSRSGGWSDFDHWSAGAAEDGSLMWDGSIVQGPDRGGRPRLEGRDPVHRAGKVSRERLQRKEVVPGTVSVMAPASACLDLQFHERRSVFVCESWRRRKFALVGSVHLQGLPRASYRGSSKDLGKGSGWRKNQNHWGFWEKGPNLLENLVEAGGIEHPSQRDSGKKR
jgi:hypothetical protein